MAAGAGWTGTDLLPRVSAAEFAWRHRAVRQAMEQENLEAILVYGGPGSPEVRRKRRTPSTIRPVAWRNPGRGMFRAAEVPWL
jgi:hypothetical protein